MLPTSKGTIWKQGRTCWKDFDFIRSIWILKIGVEVGESAEWEATSESIMTDIDAAKFQQNGKLEEYLCNTENSPLFEATHDEFWGIGLSIRAKDTIEEKGKGQKKLGLILMALRQTYLDAQSTASECTVSQTNLHSATSAADCPADTDQVAWSSFKV